MKAFHVLYFYRMRRIEAKVYGQVQGVSFRYYTQQAVRKLNSITGWVCNEPDGTVKVVAEGAEADLQALVDWLHVGSPYGQVARVAVDWCEAMGEFVGFSVRWYG